VRPTSTSSRPSTTAATTSLLRCRPRFRENRLHLVFKNIGEDWIQKEITKNCKYFLEICNYLWSLFVVEYKKRSQRIAQILWGTAIICDLFLYSNTTRDHKELQISKKYLQFFVISFCIRIQKDITKNRRFPTNICNYLWSLFVLWEA
jgi:hypothetical protein